MKLWKVVNKDRRSCMANKGKYGINYTVGKIVKPLRSTAGIFCFKTKKDAISFINKVMWFDTSQILEVELVGKIMKTPKQIPHEVTTTMLNQFYNGKHIETHAPPTGTVCCDAVKVLT